jgi:hypothetical protein
VGDPEQQVAIKYARMDFDELADAPVEALGLSTSDAAALKQALGVETVRELAEHRLVRRAQAIVNLAGPKQEPTGTQAQRHSRSWMAIGSQAYRNAFGSLHCCHLPARLGGDLLEVCLDGQLAPPDPQPGAVGTPVSPW